MRKVFITLAVVIVGILLFVFLGKEPKSAPIPAPISETREVIGTSTKGVNIESFTYGNGEKHILFVGGIHGGYEWNSIELAEEMMAHLKQNPGLIPTSTKVSIIPNLNPDATAKDATGRFNANKVDLNRNFDCKWQPTSMWRGEKVSAGKSAFSEAESRVLRDFILKNKSGLQAVVFWHSQANTVYASECTEGILPITLELMNTYAKASGYGAVPKFDAYPVTGDAEGWLASINVPAITVELKTHEDIDWSQNLAGVQAILNYFK